MRVDTLLDLLEAVRRRGHGRWSARCPGHQPDRNPSLSIAEGDRGILIRCWAGCPLEAICSALGLAVQDLFYDRPDNHCADRQRRDIERRLQEARRYIDGLRIDAIREAEKFIIASRSINIRGWTDEQLNEVLNDLSDSYDVLYQEYGYDWTATV